MLKTRYLRIRSNGRFMLKVCIYVRSEWGRDGPIFYCSSPPRPGPGARDTAAVVLLLQISCRMCCRSCRGSAIFIDLQLPAVLQNLLRLLHIFLELSNKNTSSFSIGRRSSAIDWLLAGCCTMLWWDDATNTNKDAGSEWKRYSRSRIIRVDI